MPTISQFIRSVSDPTGLARSLGDFVALRDPYGRVRVCTGRSAAIFHIVAGGGELALKCYIHPPRCGAEIYGYVRGHADWPLTRAEYLPGELYVYDQAGCGTYCDVTLAPWVEGRTLENEMRMAALAGDRARLGVLAAGFGELARALLDAPWAHGDLKPENIIVGADDRMTLVDYDAMFIPALADRPSGEIGTPGYRHPARDAAMYDRHLDDYPIALIAVALHALAEDPAHYPARKGGECVVLHPEEILAGRSALYTALLERWKAERPGLHRLAAMLQSSSPRLDGLREAMARVPG